MVMALYCAGCATNANMKACPVDISDVMRQCKYDVLVGPYILAWMVQDSEVTRVAIVGENRQTGKYCLSIAARYPKSTDESRRAWSLFNVTATGSEGKDPWPVGTMNSDRVPQKEDLIKLCKALRWKDATQWEYAR
jgi:hypothetical protein